MIISQVSPDGIGAELGLSAGDDLCKLNGLRVLDLLDYIFWDSQEAFEMTVERGDELLEFEIEKEEDETLGLTFSDNGLKAISCQNRCIFCFVDQLPEGMRSSLYVKDDDYRHSLIYGNYVTLTNLKERDVERILAYGLSPLYVSVHTTDGELRKKMLSNKRAGDILETLKLFSAHGILMHTQIVMCPGWNDGVELVRTLGDLKSIPSVQSVAIVPVGQTCFRENLCPIEPVTEAIARETLRLVSDFRARLAEAGNPLEVWCSDEFYIRAGEPIPEAEFYGNFSQIEDGVGIVAKFRQDLEEEIETWEESGGRAPFVSADLVSGESAWETVSAAAERINAKFGEIAHPHRIKNDFFGKTITVSGLITGRDLFAQLRGRLKTERLILPRVMLRDNTSVFLDDMTVAELSEKLGVEIVVSEPGRLLDAFRKG